MFFDFIAYTYFVLIAILMVGYLSVFMKWDIVLLDSIHLIRNIIQGLIAIYLLLRFHPFQNKGLVLKGSDIDIIFASATFLFFNLFIELHPFKS